MDMDSYKQPIPPTESARIRDMRKQCKILNGEKDWYIMDSEKGTCPCVCKQYCYFAGKEQYVSK